MDVRDGRAGGQKRRRVGHDQAVVDRHDAGSKPQLTRACAECKRLKIKCYIRPGQTACDKCLRGGVHCVPHNFAQKFIDDDAVWKTNATTELNRLRATVQKLLRHTGLSDLTGHSPVTVDTSNAPEEVRTVSPSDTNRSHDHAGGNFVSEGPSATFDGDDSDLVPLPMNNLYNLTEPGNSRLIRVDAAQANGPDFISRGVVSISEAEYLFDHFRDHINPQLWDGVLCSHQTLHSARQSSSLLVATVLTVAALHVPNRENFLHVTYNAFVSLMRGSCLRRSQNLDDIRGLCIGAFYLTSLSWALCSRAVRVATEMNLHKSSLQFSCGTLESYERVRLWYVLYVCDHQFALAYGRPPMMHEDAAIRNADRLLTSVYSTKGDRGLVAQVGLFRILAASYFMYGCDADLELNSQDYQMLQSFNLSIDKWRLDYQSKDSNCLSNTDHTSNGNALYYQLARFQLNSLSLRGISARRHHPSGPSLSWDRQEAANIAISAASSTLSLLLRDADLREALVGMPIFTHAMIAVCASFLLKMAVVFAESNDHAQGKLVLPTDLAEFGLNFQTSDALVKVKGVVQRLSEIAERASQGHVANQVVMGLRELLQRFRMREDGGGFLYSRGGDGPVADNTHHAEYQGA